MDKDSDETTVGTMYDLYELWVIPFELPPYINAIYKRECGVVSNYKDEWFT